MITMFGVGCRSRRARPSAARRRRIFDIQPCRPVAYHIWNEHRPRPVLAKFDRIADCALSKMVGSVIDHAIIIDGSMRHTARCKRRCSPDRIADADPSSGGRRCIP
jgi:hypothetical protein